MCGIKVGHGRFVKEIKYPRQQERIKGNKCRNKKVEKHRYTTLNLQKSPKMK